jgi:DNA-binding MarR family transcriptional regulator
MPDDLARALTAQLFDLASAVDLVGQAAAARLGINQTDLICLNLLARGGPMSPGQVAAALGLTTAAISAMASRLEAGGYARREIDRADRRRVLLHASDEGARRAFGLFDDLYAASTALGAEYSDRDLRTLVEVIERFRAIVAGKTAALRADPGG